MDSQDLTFASVIIIPLLILIICVTWGLQASNNKITRMVEAGANPMDAACAIGGNEKACILAGRK